EPKVEFRNFKGGSPEPKVEFRYFKGGSPEPQMGSRHPNFDSRTSENSWVDGRDGNARTCPLPKPYHPGQSLIRK
ncbi:MAG TPA: hypothetical protein PLM08_13095, partial [Polyangiaceae bacterium]|nr:hypothetical protein [Polyangiaceae bacterium]